MVVLTGSCGQHAQHQDYINFLDDNLLQSVENILVIVKHHAYPNKTIISDTQYKQCRGVARTAEYPACPVTRPVPDLNLIGNLWDSA